MIRSCNHFLYKQQNYVRLPAPSRPSRSATPCGRLRSAPGMWTPDPVSVRTSNRNRNASQSPTIVVCIALALDSPAALLCDQIFDCKAAWKIVSIVFCTCNRILTMSPWTLLHKLELWEEKREQRMLTFGINRSKSMRQSITYLIYFFPSRISNLVWYTQFRVSTNILKKIVRICAKTYMSYCRMLWWISYHFTIHVFCF